MRAVAIVGVAALALCAFVAHADTPATGTADALSGTWELVSIYEESDLGEDLDRWGDEPRGHFVADGNGRFMLQLVGRNVIRLGVTERACDTKGYQGIAYAGRYALDAHRKTITLAVEDALSREFDLSRRTTSITLEGDQLDFVSSAETSPTGAFYVHLRWKRVR